MFRLALCVDPKAPATAGIVEKALRSMNPEFAKDRGDKAARSARAARLGKELLQGRDIPRSAVYPGLGERWGRTTSEGIAIHIPAGSLRRLTEKIVRGVYYLDGGTFIEPPYVVEFYAINDDDAEPIGALLKRSGKVYAREPGIEVRRAAPQDAPMMSIFEIDIWGQFKMYASVETKN